MVQSASQEFWVKDYENLQKNSNTEDFLALQDEALIRLYERTKVLFNQNKSARGITGNFTLELKGKSPSKKLLYLFDSNGIEYGSTTLTYGNLKEIKEIDEPREHVLILSKKATSLDASSYKKHTKGTTESQRKQNSRNDGPGQYLPNLKDSQISEFEKAAIEKGEIRENREKVGNPKVGLSQYYFFYDVGKDIGYANGDLVTTISVEITTATTEPRVHSHPRK